MVNLGQMLRWHRGLCALCTTTGACAEYREIAAEFTQAREVWAGPTAARRVLSVREGRAS